MNKVILTGNVGQDPEVRYTAKGTAVANFSVATHEKYKGEDKTEWHKVVCWGKLAETVGEYLHKGRWVAIEGSINTSTFDDAQGNSRKETRVTASTVEFGPKPKGD